ncbi:hypothetical protein [Streptomyces sp. NPDC058872]|uniref:hypothetical protein n=1 Tax=Streptomyces sp. NPDC058872 TaxID=3346661 RepID=UPI003684012E
MTATRTARLTGAALCAALALITAGWILEDLAVLGSPADLVWYWAGDRHFLVRGRSATSLIDAVLLVGSAATAVAALRSRHAASALAATGTVTLALRLPGLWAPGSGALVTALLELALAGGLVLTAAVGRRPAGPHEQPPTSPRTGPAVAAGVLLLVAALVVTGWELYWAGKLPLETTADRFTGGRSVVRPALAPPPGWLSTVLAALYGTAGALGLARARHSRAFGLLAAAFLTAGGLGGVARSVRYETFTHLGDPTSLYAMGALTSALELLAGIAVFVLLAGRGAPAAAPAPHPVAGTPAPTPARPRPPGR